MSEVTLVEAINLALARAMEDDPNVVVRPCVNGRVWARDPIPAMLDGEFFRLGRRVDAHFRPHAFRALTPRRGPAPPGHSAGCCSSEARE